MIAPPSNPPSMVEVKNVSMHFNFVEAVKAVSFNVDSGNIFGLVGSDGAGKSTLLRLIATMIKPSQGEIYINGLNVLTDRRKIKNIIRLRRRDHAQWVVSAFARRKLREQHICRQSVHRHFIERRG